MAVETHPRLRVTVAQLAPTAHVASVAGELDAAGAAALGERLAPLARQPYAHVILDLHDVAFADACAHETLAALAALVRSGGGELVLVAPTPRLRRLAEVGDAAAPIPVEGTLTEAVEKVVSGLYA